MNELSVPVAGLFETHLTVSELSRSVAFYRDVIGLPLAFEAPDRGAAFFWIAAPGEGLLGLWSIGSAPVGLTLHLAFKTHLEDVLGACERLRSLGVTPLSFFAVETDEPSVIGWMPAAAVYLRDPDGHLLEYLTMLDEPARPGARHRALVAVARRTGTFSVAPKIAKRLPALAAVYPRRRRVCRTMTNAHYPTSQHERAAAEITSFFTEQADTQAVLLTNSCARGKATPDSCLDMQVLTQTERVAELGQLWRRFAAKSAAIAELNAVGRWADVHLDVTDAVFEVRPIDHELDWLEVEVGNLLVYSISLLDRGNRLRELRGEWLPFYDEKLRAERLLAAQATCLGYLDRIPWFLDRQLWFQALARLHGAFSWFLLALHVKHRTYPIAYDKWIREQIVENLALPQLYERLPALFEIAHLESRELDQKAAELRTLADTYLA